MREALDLVRASRREVDRCRERRREELARDARPLLLCGIGLFGALAATLFVASLPLTSLWCLAGAGVSGAALAILPPRQGGDLGADLEKIAALELREKCRVIVAAHGELAAALGGDPGLAATAGPVLERSEASVRLCGRIARIANRVYEYLITHDPAWIATEATRLRAKAEAAADPTARDAFARAAAARRRQLDTYEQLLAIRERIHARLDLTCAALHSFSAVVVRLRSLDDEERALAGEALLLDADELHDGLDTLAAALELDPAA